MEEAVVGVAEEDETRRASGGGREKGGNGRKERVEEERLYRQAEGFKWPATAIHSGAFPARSLLLRVKENKMIILQD